MRGWYGAGAAQPSQDDGAEVGGGCGKGAVRAALVELQALEPSVLWVKTTQGGQDTAAFLATLTAYIARSPYKAPSVLAKVHSEREPADVYRRMLQTVPGLGPRIIAGAALPPAADVVDAAASPGGARCVGAAAAAAVCRAFGAAAP
eukprot:gene27503-26493_t